MEEAWTDGLLGEGRGASRVGDGGLEPDEARKVRPVENPEFVGDFVNKYDGPMGQRRSQCQSR